MRTAGVTNIASETSCNQYKLRLGNVRRIIDHWVFISFLRFAARRKRFIGATNAFEAPQSVLLFKPDGIGDFILWSEVYKEFHARHQEATITALVCAPTGAMLRAMFPRWGIIEMPHRPRSTIEFLLMLFKSRKLRSIPSHEILVDLRVRRGNWETLYVAMLKADRKVGFASENIGMFGLGRHDRSIFDWILTKPSLLPFKSDKSQCHELKLVDAFRSQFWSLNRTAPPPDLRPFFSSPGRHSAEMPYWILAPFSGSEIRNYPLDGWLSVFLELKHCGYSPRKLLICGSRAQKKEGYSFASKLEKVIQCENLCGDLSLDQTAVLLAGSQIVFATESAIGHLSVALRKRTVIVLGGGHYGLFAPWGEAVAPVRWTNVRLSCYDCNWRCPYDKPFCITNIPAGDLAQSAMALLAE